MKLSTLTLWLCLALCFCGSKEEGNAPTGVITTAVSGITDSEAVSGGTIQTAKPGDVTLRGVCWNTSSPALISHAKSEEGAGGGSFTSRLTALEPETKYYVRAYFYAGGQLFYGNHIEFSTTAANTSGYSIYLGNLHSHTYYSGDVTNKNAVNSPATLFAEARANGYDFYTVSDHTQYVDFTHDAWAEILTASHTATTASFVAIRGFEYSSSKPKGHINIFDSPDWVVAYAGNYANPLKSQINFSELQDWLTTSENGQVTACFNHPDTHHFESFALYKPAAKSHFSMIELVNGNNLGKDSQSDSWYYDIFKLALEKGWRVSPVAGCDNHGSSGIPKWECRTGIAATALTKTGVMEALRNRRTYASTDKTLKAYYSVNDKPMGSIITSPSGDLRFSVICSGAKNNITKMEIIGRNDVVLASKSFSGKSVTWDAALPKGTGYQPYYYVVIYEGNDVVAWMAPVWIE